MERNIKFCTDGILIWPGEWALHIGYSYMITDRHQMYGLLCLAKTHANIYNIFYKRSIRSWLNEWEAMNLLYKFGFKREKTCQLNLSDSTSLFKRAVYFLLSCIY